MKARTKKIVQAAAIAGFAVLAEAGIELAQLEGKSRLAVFGTCVALAARFCGAVLAAIPTTKEPT